MTDRADAPLAFDRVSFAYDSASPIVRDLSFDVRRGRVLALLGPNGTGKTTILKLLVGALAPSSGRVSRSARTGFVPQLAQTSFAYSALEMVLMGRARSIGLFSTPSRRDESAALDALAQVGVDELALRPFDTLSGGERQLVMFARALVADAQVLVLDEPAAALDLLHQQTILHQIKRLSADRGITVVFSTHLPQHASAVADDVALLHRDGSVVIGATGDTLTSDALERLFGVAMQRAGATFVPVWNLSAS